ncbi:MAG TPA: bifunctional phosphoribosylaminoimidazolecarboxamide formyltransferase/IMP cyclohydrolase [Buchnera sp. (in: enterobacteria)]|nr:bifunctional phosphoribosylaminoimidazolecarboxamide formyltransferase/IMP cyclohydrolase [Buchnera sp. (in: enterobacteria)]
MKKNKKTKRALISVCNTSGIIHFAKFLNKKKIKIIATEGTKKILQKKNIPVTSVSEYIEFPEIMNGRVKSMHPKIFGGILGRQEKDTDIMKLYGIKKIHLVIVNLYPFLEKQKILKNNFFDLSEYIDIGGVSLIRAAAKNCSEVLVIVSPGDYNKVIKMIDLNGIESIPLEKKIKLAQKAFSYTSHYDDLISKYFLKKIKKTEKKNTFPEILKINLIKKIQLRYGENPHQKSAFYIEEKNKNNIFEKSKQIQGKKISYNNILDLEIAWNCVQNFKNPACAIVKHSIPCGVCESESTIKSYTSAYQCDPISAFGGVISFNSKINQIVAKTILKNQFVEVIIAPIITKNALEIFKKRKNIIVLTLNQKKNSTFNLDFKSSFGGMLIQEQDNCSFEKNNKKKYWKTVTNRKIITNKEKEDAIFAWKIVKYVKSNAIVIVKNRKTIGIGSGQTSRIFSTKISNLKAIEQNLDTIGATMASDAFFPFSDSIKLAAKIGITCIIQPGGSIRDKEVISAANKSNMIMLFTNKRCFKH